MKYITTLVFVSVLTSVGLMPLAASATSLPPLPIYYFSPDFGSYTGQDEISVELRYSGDSVDPITSIKSYINYDPSLRYGTVIDTTNSDFAYWWEKALTRGGSLGQIRLQASSPESKKIALITTIHFRALKAGSATLTHDESSLALTANDQDVLNVPGSPGATLTLTGTSFFTPSAYERNLRVGDQNADVKRLQAFLNSSGYQLVSQGPGSPGNETTYFGSLTKRAVIRFQEANTLKILSPFGLTKGTGFVGPSTRAFLNKNVRGSSSEVISLLDKGLLPVPPRSAVFSRSLFVGVQHEEVKSLQELFASDTALYPEGLITGYFGPLTERAVQRFQLKHGVVADSTDPGYGIVGPKTRARLQEIFGQ